MGEIFSLDGKDLSQLLQRLPRERVEAEALHNTFTNDSQDLRPQPPSDSTFIFPRGIW